MRSQFTLYQLSPVYTVQTNSGSTRVSFCRENTANPGSIRVIVCRVNTTNPGSTRVSLEKCLVNTTWVSLCRVNRALVLFFSPGSKRYIDKIGHRFYLHPNDMTKLDEERERNVGKRCCCSIVAFFKSFCPHKNTIRNSASFLSDKFDNEA